MYVLHAHWQASTPLTEMGDVLFWAETAPTALPARPDRRRRKAQPHPFCANEQTVRQLLRELTAFDGQRQAGAATLWLPTGKQGPQPSPQLVHDWELDARTPITLTTWQVSGVWVTPLAAFAALTNLPAAQDLPHHIRLGDDVRFWEIAANLVLESLAQQKILPTLVQEGKQGYAARWQPVLDGPRDGPRLARLASAMPPLCRAGTADPQLTPSSRLVLETFLNTMTDALARQWGQAKAPFFTYQQNEPVHHWLRALFQSEAQVTGSAAQLQRLYTSYQAWLRNLHMAGDRQFRIAFRLEAPAQQEVESRSKSKRADWMLHFLLQARDDPSLLAPAQVVWQTRGNVLTALNRQFENPQEKLLAGLGYAARLFEPVRRSLQSAKPSAAALSAQEAFTFLRESAPLLEESGFGVLVPPWWNKPGTRLGVRLRMGGRSTTGADNVRAQGLTFENLVRYRWELSLGDTTLTREEFDALVALKSPLVQIRGQWVQLDPEQIEAAIRFWQQYELEDEVSLQEALQLGLGAEQMDGLTVENVEYEGWLADWMARFTGNEQLITLPQPARLRGQLRPYQVYGYSWLDFLRRSGMGACLADDMGLGKCLAPESLVFVNGTLRTAQDIWEIYAGHLEFDGEGYWAVPNEGLWVNAMDENSGRIVVTPIQRIYRQYIREKLRVIKLKDGSSITITQRHRLLTNKGWTNHLHVNDYVCVPARLHWDGQPVDPDLVKFLAWQLTEGYEPTGQATLFITKSQKESHWLDQWTH